MLIKGVGCADPAAPEVQLSDGDVYLDKGKDFWIRCIVRPDGSVRQAPALCNDKTSGDAQVSQEDQRKRSRDLRKSQYLNSTF